MVIIANAMAIEYYYGWHFDLFTVIGRKLLIFVNNVVSCSKNKSMALSVNCAHKRHCFDILHGI